MADGAAGPDSDPASPSCGDLFGGADAYHLCGESPDRCEFYTDTGGTPCSDICAQFGTLCIDAWDADAPQLCVQRNADDCSGERGDIVCVCAR